MAENVKLLEDAANALQSSANPQHRAQAEQVLLQFRQSANPFPTCFAVLQTSANIMAVFHVFSALKEATVREFWTLNQTNSLSSLVERLLMYLYSARHLPCWLAREGLHVVAVLFKRSHVHNIQQIEQTVFKYLTQLLTGPCTQPQLEHDRLIGLLLGEALVAEFSTSSISQDFSAAQHLEAHRWFETRSLPEVFNSVRSLIPWLLSLLVKQQTSVLPLLDNCFRLISSILSWEFVADHDLDQDTLLAFRLLQLTTAPQASSENEDELSEDIGLSPGRQSPIWRNELLSPQFLLELQQTYLSLLKSIGLFGEGPVLACVSQLRQCLFSLASLRGSIFQKDDTEGKRETWQAKANFFSGLFCSVQTTLLNGASSSTSLSNEGQEEEIVDAARIFYRLVSNPDVDIVLLSRMPKHEHFFQESLSLMRFLMCARSSDFASKVATSDPDDMCQAASNMLAAWSTLGEQALNFDQNTDQFLSPGERQRVDSAISRIFELFVTSRLRLASLFAQMDHSDDDEEEDIHGPELGATEVELVAKMGWQLCPLQSTELLLQRGDALVSNMIGTGPLQDSKQSAEGIQFQCMQEQMRFLLHTIGFFLKFTTSALTDVFGRISSFLMTYNDLENSFITAQFRQYRWRLLLRMLWCLDRWGQLLNAAYQSGNVPSSQVRWHEVLAEKAFNLLTNNLSWITTGDLVYERAVDLLVTIPPPLLIFCVHWSKLVVAYFKNALQHLSGPIRGRLLGLIAQVGLETSTDLGLAKSLVALGEFLQPALWRVEGWLNGKELNEQDGGHLLEGLDILTGLANTTGAPAAARFIPVLFDYLQLYLKCLRGLSRLMEKERIETYLAAPSPLHDPAQLKLTQTLLLLKFTGLLHSMALHKAGHMQPEQLGGVTDLVIEVWPAVLQSVVYWLHQTQLSRGSKLCLEQLVDAIDSLLQTMTLLAKWPQVHPKLLASLQFFRPLLPSSLLTGRDDIVQVYLHCLGLVCACYYEQDSPLVCELSPLLSNFRLQQSVLNVFLCICALPSKPRIDADIVELQRTLWAQLQQGNTHGAILDCLHAAVRRNPAAFRECIGNGSEATGLPPDLSRRELEGIVARVLLKSGPVTIHLNTGIQQT